MKQEKGGQKSRPDLIQPIPKLRITLLFASYLSLGVGTRFVANRLFAEGIYYQGWIFVQAVVCALLMLLGFWLILTKGSVAWRIMLSTAVIIYSTALISNGSLQKFLSTFTLICIFFPLCAIAARLVIYSYWKVEFKRLDEITSDRQDALRFSIRHLLALMVLVGILVSITNGMRDFQPASAQLIQWGALAVSSSSVIGVVMLCMSFFTIAITSLWATLSLSSPWLRVCFVLILATGSGALYPYVLQKELNEFIPWVTSCLFTTTLVVSSLLVVRSCDIRLVQPQ